MVWWCNDVTSDRTNAGQLHGGISVVMVGYLFCWWDICGSDGGISVVLVGYLLCWWDICGVDGGISVVVMVGYWW